MSDRLTDQDRKTVLSVDARDPFLKPDGISEISLSRAPSFAKAAQVDLSRPELFHQCLHFHPILFLMEFELAQRGEERHPIGGRCPAHSDDGGSVTMGPATLPVQAEPTTSTMSRGLKFGFSLYPLPLG